MLDLQRGNHHTAEVLAKLALRSISLGMAEFKRCSLMDTLPGPASATRDSDGAWRILV